MVTDWRIESMKNIKHSSATAVMCRRKQCKTCGSFALNEYPESGGLCDVCYWKGKYEKAEAVLSEIVDLNQTHNTRLYIDYLCRWILGKEPEPPNKDDFGL